MATRLTKADIIESACNALTHPRTQMIMIIFIIIIKIYININLESASTALDPPLQIWAKEEKVATGNTSVSYW